MTPVAGQWIRGLEAFRGLERGDNDDAEHESEERHQEAAEADDQRCQRILGYIVYIYSYICIYLYYKYIVVLHQIVYYMPI